MNRKPTEDAFVRNMHRLRHEKKWSQDTLAHLAGVKRSTIAAYEQGISRPALALAVNIANTLGVGLEEMCGLRKKKKIEDLPLKKTVDEIFSKNMHRLRREKKLSQEQLAQMIGVKKITLAAWEQGRNRPSLGRAVDIANALGVNLEEMCGVKAPSEK